MLKYDESFGVVVPNASATITLADVFQVLRPQLDPLTEQQFMAVYNLQQSSQQAEDALSQGLDKLQQTLAETITSDPLDTSNMANYMGLMTNAMGQLEALISFVNQVILQFFSPLSAIHIISSSVNAVSFISQAYTLRCHITVSIL